MRLTGKQSEYVRRADRRWNFKGGATRSGKTWLDFHWVIPSRIRERAGQEGLVLLLGVSRGTLERNVLSPMRDLYGGALVGPLSAGGRVRLFGEDCFALGAGRSTGVSALRGASVKYAYGDEVAEWHPEVFRLLASRMDRPCSVFDGTYNPKGRTHWLYRFLTGGADVFSQQYGLDDNPYLPPAFAEALRREYRGTVYYDRYILGRWASPEGALFEREPPTTADEGLLRGGIAHVDAAYGGADGTALTLGRRTGDGICLYGRLWRAHADTALDAIAAECRRFACQPVYCERNGDRGYLAAELRRRGIAAVAYTERENKFVKISTFLRKWWGRAAFLEGTDRAYLDEILDYTETAAHDDAPDSAACVCRLLDRRGGEEYRSPFGG